MMKEDENEIYLKWKWIKLKEKEIGRKKGSVKNVKCEDIRWINDGVIQWKKLFIINCRGWEMK